MDRASTHQTVVKLTITMSHPLWEGDGQDEKIAVENLQGTLSGILLAGDTYSIDEVDTVEGETS